MMGTKWNKLWGRTRRLIIAGAVRNVPKEPVDMVNPSLTFGSTKHQVYSATGRLINIYQLCESWVEDG